MAHSHTESHTEISFAENHRGFQLAQNFAHVHIAPGKPALATPPQPRHANDGARTRERPETLPQPSSNVPFRRDPEFVERPALTDQIHDKISAPAGRAALVGLGGVG